MRQTVAHPKTRETLPTEEGASPAAVFAPRRITARVVGLSLLLIFALCWWIAYSEIKTGTTEITVTSLPIGVLFLLFVVCCLNALVKRLWPGRALAPGELAAIYVLVAVGASVAGLGTVGLMTPALANPLWFTNETWSQFGNLVPSWWAPRDPEAIRAFYVGDSTLYKWRHILAWLPPILTWGAFSLTLIGMTLCFVFLLRRHWIEHERLAFPITQVPLAMTVQSGGFGSLMRNRALLLGFAVPVVLQTINNLNWLFPNIPFIPVKPTPNGPLDFGSQIKTPPWNALGYFPLSFHPNSIGLAYLLPTDISFSFWFFYLARKGSEVWCTALGLRMAGGTTPSARLPYTLEQGAGAWLCLALVSLWIARGHLRSVWRCALRPRSSGDVREAFAYRAAFVGLFACFLGAVLFVWQGGLPLGPALLLMAVFGLYMLALARIRAESGMPWHFGPWWNPQEMVVRTFGPMNISTGAMAVLAYHNWFNFDYRNAATPHLFEGYRIADQARLEARRLTVLMLLVLAFGFLCATWATLHMYYIHGAGSAHITSPRLIMSKQSHLYMARHLAETRVGPDTAGFWGIGAGALITLLLQFGRMRFSGWPFHPTGYAIANTFTPDLLWFPFLLGWLAKGLTLRYGGMNAYRTALPFFIGLILGDYVIASLWTFFGIIMGIDMYRCFPN